MWHEHGTRLVRVRRLRRCSRGRMTLRLLPGILAVKSLWTAAAPTRSGCGAAARRAAAQAPQLRQWNLLSQFAGLHTTPFFLKRDAAPTRSGCGVSTARSLCGCAGTGAGPRASWGSGCGWSARRTANGGPASPASRCDCSSRFRLGTCDSRKDATREEHLCGIQRCPGSRQACRSVLGCRV